MAPTVARAAETRPANSIGETGQRGARSCFEAALNANAHVPRKAVAADVLGRDDESQFSKMVGGTRPFDLDHLDAVPRDILIAWMKTYGSELGLVVRELDLPELTERVLTLVDELATVSRLVRVRRPRVPLRRSAVAKQEESA